ncbi:MAG: sensor domain-containing protein, partial [Gammaproteobacteria bacterium]
YAVFNVFRGEENAFDGEAVDLFREMAADIGFALDNIDREIRRREAEKSLAESEARLSEIMENVGAYIYLKDSEGRYLYANRQMLDLWGRSLEEVVGFTAEKFHDSETAAKIRETDDKVLVEGEIVRREEFKTFPRTGKTMTCWSVNIPLRRKDGGIYALCGIATDISERIRLESSLREKERMLSESQRIAGIGSWRIEYPSGRIAWSDQSYRINRVRPERFGHTLEAFIKLIHPEDRQSMLDWIQSCLAGNSPAPLRVKILAGDGEARILEVQGELKRGPDGGPFEINGTMQDITERWLAERQLRLNAKVFECNQEGIVIADSDNYVVSVNRAYSEITGYAAEEVVGKNPRFLTAEKYDRGFYRKMWRDVRNKGRWQGEVFNRRKNGDFYPQWLSISVIRDETGRISHFIGIVNDMTEYKKAEERIRFLSNFDDLTGLPNLHLLRDRTEVALASAKRSQGTAVLMYIDLDRFKIVNDSLGHNAGDRLLKELSARLVRNLHGDDTLCRHGGDEFLLLLPNTDPEGAAHVARKILGYISEPFEIDGNRLMPTASIGVAVFPQDGVNFEYLVQSADAALFRAKKRGRNCFHFFTPQMHEQAQEVLQVENDLRLALERGELVLHYQPLIDAKSLRIVGAEALIRWRHPGKGMVPPGHFIPIAEESGLIVEIGNWVLNAAVRQMADWRAAGAPLVPVAVNLSAMQFRQDTFFQTVDTVLRASNLEPEALELELTENIAMENSERTIELLKRLHNLGVALSLDDFGTGYSSLGYLKRFKINKLKIDQSFVRGLGGNPEDETIVITIINMAKSLGFKTIAEGVETREQLVFLQERGCDVIQGYYFSRPVPADAFTELLMKGVPLSDPDGG